MTNDTRTLIPALRVGGARRSFEQGTETEYVVAMIAVRIAIDPSREVRGRDSGRGVQVMAERAVHAVANSYSWYSAQIDSVTLVSAVPEARDD